ncbi:MAG: MATE family efflux transporter [Clostridiales bacterium]|nr:MATE family efflux transporter [Clostridiales bacterium]
MTEQFGTENILKLMLKFSLPAMVASTVNTSYHLINTIFISRAVGPMGIAAIAIGGPISSIQGAFNQLVGNGCAAAVAIRVGKGDKEIARGLVGCSVTFSFTIALINVFIAQMFKVQLVTAFGASPALVPMASEYLTISLFGMLIGFFTGLNPLMRIEGYPGRAMGTMLVSAAVNSIATPLFLFVFKLGIRGAALGTLCGQVASAIWMMSFLLNKDRVIGLKWKHARFNFSYFLEMAKLGLPNCLMNVTQSMLSVTMNRSLTSYGGDMALSAWGICNNINGFVQQPIFGLNQGTQPIIGYNVGAKNYHRVKEALFKALAVATFFATLGWLITRLFPVQLMHIFTDNEELIGVGSSILITFRMLIMVVGTQQVGAAFFQNSGKGMTAALLTLSRQIFILIPAVLILPRYFGFTGILYAGPVADGLSSLITGTFLFFEVKRYNRLIKEQEAQAALGAPDDASIFAAETAEDTAAQTPAE